MRDCEMKKKCLDFIVFLSPLWIGIFWKLQDILHLDEDTTIALGTCLMIVLGILFVVSIVLDVREWKKREIKNQNNVKLAKMSVMLAVICTTLLLIRLYIINTR